MSSKMLIQHNALITARYEMSAAEKNITYMLLAQLGKKAMLPPPPPLRTQRASCPALRSSTPQPQLIRLQPVLLSNLYPTPWGRFGLS